MTNYSDHPFFSKSFQWLFLSIALSSSVFYSCSPISNRALSKTFHATEEKFKDHVGFVLYDPAKKKTLFDYQGAQYFTPASNTKIFTFFTSLKILGDSIPGLRYIVHGDSLIFWGTGDPGLLYKNVYTNGRVYNFLKASPYKLFFSVSNFDTEHFGPGWAWDDYSSYYSAERSPLPIYGNIAAIQAIGNKPEIQPPFFKKELRIGIPQSSADANRESDKNVFTYIPGTKVSSKVIDVPLKISPFLTATLLSDTLNKSVTLLNKPFDSTALTIFNIPSDSLYRIMMQESDNFIAEQLLLLCAGTLSDTLKTEIAIEYSKKNFLNDLSDDPIWKDGSGLSRFNLFTPRSIVQLWEKIYTLVPQERLFTLLAIGGKKGTIRNYYKETQPYIFGKTGSLSNNHALSGYLLTKRGKVLIFSFMNTHFAKSTSEVRNNMQEILHKIYEAY
ncbi:D-alanyl-D-alanine carboxypeptidase/D-alanyl-D-alanine-endopeptidase [Ohtaekwangia koreensis]|uniref:D-alanyl-D-alanine carboxypeptidase / D-alanyl-D-alanine-endopeptidase (Penicillin-binding protein 4) n=1 Tax=Ohtaekwangia koreensis TaxID=688867 RepID=A0A1T5LH11_9BACT|nr:D-alanyl-D-alanine carboxypeptidase [Ohtaekwangia koreensis]SKC74648.1 D-alanyl-D-alanine carboxypeptidase / D-alanyl-D-alanine-endopeptidase (penicillin-binding protein 4) [Ohtaekwangia koreensis]